MSTELAIAAVTKTLVSLLTQAQIQVTTKTPDVASQDGNGERVNLFLYHTMPNPSWRNRDIPGRVRPGERGNPPLALNLYFILTAYGEDGINLADQRVLGKAMQVLHDRPILKSKDVRTATLGDRDLNESTLHDQVENVRIAADTLTIEEMSRLWTTFQTQYRVSAAYQAAVVLIESKRPTRSALPVARRGEMDRGVQSNLGVDATIEGVEYRKDTTFPKMPSAKVGDTILLVGRNIPAAGLTVVVRDPKIASSNDEDVIARLKPEVITPGSILKVELGEDAGVWSAGMLFVELEYLKEKRKITSNAVALALAPQIQTSGVGESVIAFVNDAADGKRILQLSLQHPLGENRRVLLVLTKVDQSTAAGSDARSFFQLSQLPDDSGLGSLSPSFDVTDVPTGKYWVRVRVDGVDSMLMQVNVDENNRPSVEFDPKQKVEI